MPINREQLDHQVVEPLEILFWEEEGEDAVNEDAKATVLRLQTLIQRAELVVFAKSNGTIEDLASGWAPELLDLEEKDVQRLKSLEKHVKFLIGQYGYLRSTTKTLYSDYKKKRKKLSRAKSYSERELRRVLEIQRAAHKTALDSLAPGAVITAIQRAEKPRSSSELEAAKRRLASYFRVREFSSPEGLVVTATTTGVAEQVIQRLTDNEETNVVIVKSPPGSGKTTFMDDLEVLLHHEGYVVVQLNFDKFASAFFTKVGKQTKEWSSHTALEFDKSLFDLKTALSTYYPEAYKDKRFVVLIDTLGYNIDEMLYGLGLVYLMKEDINKGEALVLSIIAERGVIEVAKRERPSGKVDTKSSKTIAKKLVKGAPADAIVRHHNELDKNIAKLAKDDDFNKLVASIDLSAFPQLDEDEAAHLTRRLAYAIVTKNSLEIRSHWWFILNLLRQGEESE